MEELKPSRSILHGSPTPRLNLSKVGSQSLSEETTVIQYCSISEPFNPIYYKLFFLYTKVPIILKANVL